MSKKIKLILNILIVLAAVGFLASVINIISGLRYRSTINSQDDPVETYAGIFEYMLDQRAYGEIVDDYFFKRNKSFEPLPGYEDLYKVGEYAHTAFMITIYEAKEDSEKLSEYEAREKELRANLGQYEFAADAVGELLQRSLD